MLAVGVSQSGETADTLAAMELAGERGRPGGRDLNVRGSSGCWRLAEARLLTQAGPEIGVASTKAFTTQLVALPLLALGLRAARGGGGRGRPGARRAPCSGCPLEVEQVLATDRDLYRRGVDLLAERDSLYLGRGSSTPSPWRAL